MEFTNELIELGKDDYAIPFNEVIRLISFYKYGDPYRVAFLLIALTGCRLVEINGIKTDSFSRNYVIWFKGKNQKGQPRKEKIPSWFIRELEYYKKNYRKAEGRKMFGFNGESLVRHFNKKTRGKLGGNWIKKRPVWKNSKILNEEGEVETIKVQEFEHIYQIKGLRHNFMTLDFANNLDKWGKDLAIEFTAKGRHSSYKMTARHYIQNFDSLDINKFKGMDMGEILRHSNQCRLIEFC